MYALLHPSHHTLTVLFALLDFIDVDLERPEANNGFYVFDLGQTVQGVGEKWEDKTFFGYAIARKIDIRFVLDDPKAKLFKCHVSVSNELKVSEPAWDFKFLKNRDACAEKAPANLVGAIDDSHEKYYNGRYGPKEERFWAHYTLKFPGDLKLNASRIYQKAGNDEWCDLNIMPVQYKAEAGVEIIGKLKDQVLTTKITDYYAVWIVANIAMKDRKNRKHEVGEEISDVAQKLKGLGLGIGN